VLFDQRFELTQALLQAAADLAQNVSHTGLLVAVESRTGQRSDHFYMWPFS
jgi:hypothetical protein